MARRAATGSLLMLRVWWFTTAVLAASAADTGAGSLPSIAAGLWQVSEQFDGEWAPTVREICIAPGDASRHALTIPLDPGECRVERVRQADRAWISESTCVLPGIVTTMRSVARGDFRTRVRIESELRHVPAMPDGSIASIVVTEAVRLGPCPSSPSRSMSR
jgi:hypothetical protein